MLKVTSLVLGLLTVIAIVPKSDAMLTNDRPLSIEQPAGNLHAQIIFQIGQPDYRNRGQAQRRREFELAREREAERRRREYYQRNHYRGRDRDRNYGEYRRVGEASSRNETLRVGVASPLALRNENR